MRVSEAAERGRPYVTNSTDIVALASGRPVAVHRLSEGTSGRTVVLCHAAPGAGTFDPDPEQTHRRDVTLIAIDRPGYGRSTPIAPDNWATVASAADDIAEVLSHMADAPVGVAGWSAGGRVALALAARHPELVDRVAVIATPAPNEEEPWIPEEQRVALDMLADVAPAEVRAIMLAQFAPLVPEGGDASEAMGLLGASDADRGVLDRPGVRERLANMLAAAFAQGATGLVDDVAGYTLQPWGFDCDGVRAKVLLQFGADDPIAASAHGRWWQSQLPSARLEITPNVGHLVVVPQWGRTLAHLAPGTRR